MAIALGYPASMFHIFVGTLRDKYEGDIVLIVEDVVDPGVRAYCNRQRVMLLPKASTRMNSSTTGSAVSLKSKQGLNHAQFSRYGTYPRLCSAAYSAVRAAWPTWIMLIAITLPCPCHNDALHSAAAPASRDTLCALDTRQTTKRVT